MNKPSLLIAAATLSICLLSCAQTLSQVVSARTSDGTIQGERIGEISSFKGIPFAAAPVGPLRWKAPQPVKPWDGVRKTTTFGPSPMQNAFVAGLMGIPNNFNEDCLYLNVWTAATNAAQKLPVMVWIYGGAFAFGSTAIPVYDGTKLAQKGVVVVSVAYRVGAFGFLAHPELTKEGSKGNFGILDQIAGLEWVRKNIAAFGGDPDRVTIFGESAGAESVSLLVTCPKAKGLFHGAIAESGALFAPPKHSNEAGLLVPPLELAQKEGVKFLSDLGVRDIDAARCLPADKILKADFGTWPCYDGELLPDDAYTLFRRGTFNDTPILIGFNSDDGGMFVQGSRKPDEFVAELGKSCGEFADRLLAAYPHANSKEATRSWKVLVRDALFSWPTWCWAKLQAEKGRGRAFVYFYDHRTPKSPDGAGHSAEIEYVFQNLQKPRSEDSDLSERICSYWVNFAKTGNPNASGLPEWEPFTTNHPNLMLFDGISGMVPMPDLPRIEVLDAYFTWRRGHSPLPH